MSQAHIPQPLATGPAEVFDSTADASPSPNLSGIGTSGPSPREVSPHTGAMNTIDITVQNQFIPTDTITWNTQQTRGTMIWNTPIHPTMANPIIRYLSGMYNTWAGGLEYNFKVAGTGFHAGAVAVVRVPPNIDPSTLVTPSMWGPFEWVVIDPKTLEVTSAHVIDQRPNMYHYTRLDLSSPNSFGGYIAMYVLLPLNTSATGSNTIQIQVFNRMGADFQFSQLISPYLESPVSAAVLPEIVNQIFDFPLYENYLSATPFRARTLTIEAGSVKTKVTGLFNCFNIDGVSIAAVKYPEWLPPSDLILTFANRVAASGFIDVRTRAAGALPKIDTSSSGIISLYSPAPPIANQSMSVQYESNALVAPNADYYATKLTTSPVASDQIPEYTWFAPTNTQNFEDCIDLNSMSLPVPESLVYFAYNDSNLVTSLQTSLMSQFMYSKTFARLIPPGKCMVMVMVDITENLPIGYLKLWREGWFSASPATTRVTFPLANLRFIFDSYILRTDPIPSNSTYATNRLLLSMKYATSQPVNLM